jgi:DNA-binding PadR family transcriptional regulator
MARTPNSSRQIRGLIAALLQAPSDWRHGYDLSRETGLKSGTLYPILMRLEGSGWLEARWEDQPAPGKPRRHLYRLTARGQAEGQALLTAAQERATSPLTGRQRARGAAG